MAIIIKITNSKSFLCGGMETSIKEEGVLDSIPVELIFILSSSTGRKASSCVISLLQQSDFWIIGLSMRMEIACAWL